MNAENLADEVVSRLAELRSNYYFLATRSDTGS